MGYGICDLEPARGAALAAAIILLSGTLTVAAQVPGESLAPEALQRETTDKILALDQKAAPDCHSRKIARTEVTQAKGKVTSLLFMGNPEAWQEHW